jgi:hypothetical protein
MLHHIIASFHIALHHTSYRINSRLSTKQIFGNILMSEKCAEARSELLANTILSGKSVDNSITQQICQKGASFFTKHEKKGRCFSAEGSKTVCA